MKRTYPDYLEAHLQPMSSKWVSDNIVRDRRIALYGIDIAIVQESGKAHINPVIPSIGPLIRLIKANHKMSQFQWDKKKRKWKPA